MTTLLELVLELVFGMAECVGAWRFFLCLMCSLAVVGGIWWLMPEGIARNILSIPMVAAGVIGGLAWEWRTKRYP
jgi:hypothetical protein